MLYTHVICIYNYYCYCIICTCRNSAVGVATGYGLDGSGIESPWGRDFPHPSTSALGPTQTLIQWVPCLSRVVKRSGRGVNHPPHLAPWLKNE